MTFASTFGWSSWRDPSGPVTCAACGCRLREAPGLEGIAWRHFQLAPDTDARGDRPKCLEDLHARDGYVMSVRDLEGIMLGSRGDRGDSPAS